MQDSIAENFSTGVLCSSIVLCVTKFSQIVNIRFYRVTLDSEFATNASKDFCAVIYYQNDISSSLSWS